MRNPFHTGSARAPMDRELWGIISDEFSGLEGRMRTLVAAGMDAGDPDAINRGWQECIESMRRVVERLLVLEVPDAMGAPVADLAASFQDHVLWMGDTPPEAHLAPEDQDESPIESVRVRSRWQRACQAELWQRNLALMEAAASIASDITDARRG